MKFKWDFLLTTTLFVCALTTTALVVHREFTSSQRSMRAAADKPLFINDWQFNLTQGVLLGGSTASVHLVVFADFECPFCAVFHKTVKRLRERYPTQVALTYMHLPLPMHRFATYAVRAVECAGRQKRFEMMYDRLFEGQNSFGLKPWSEYAVQAGVPDLVAFELCTNDTSAIPRLEAGKQLAAKLGVKGTPTIIINGWQLPVPPTYEELDEMIRAVLSGKSPVEV